ncbi:MAG: heme oxygenase (biliverdin-producing) [Candidatus Binatia bacterium]
MTVLLSSMLREGTMEVHRTAEKTPFMQAFFSGRIDVHAYREFLIRLYQVYGSLERIHASLQERPPLNWFYDSRLLRASKLITDLEYYYGPQWRTHGATLSTAARAYIERLITLARGWPEGLIAHHYVRYLVDLSGGPALKRLVRKTFSPLPGDGTAFYEFPDIPDLRAFKAEYRTKLDALPIDMAIARRIVDEANAAFWLNIHLVADLARQIEAR